MLGVQLANVSIRCSIVILSDYTTTQATSTEKDVIASQLLTGTLS